MPAEKSKTCTKCGEDKPLGDYYRNRRAKDGRFAACKVCVRATQKTYKVDLDKRRARGRRDWATKPKRRAQIKRWRKDNRDQVLASQKRHRERNKEAIAVAWGEWYAKNRKSVATRAKAWREANPEKKRASRNPELQRQDRDRRRARLLNAFVADVKFDDILLRDLGVCGICEEQIVDPYIELDHIHPLAAGGTHEPDNVQLAHRTCNRRKWMKAA